MRRSTRVLGTSMLIFLTGLIGCQSDNPAGGDAPCETAECDPLADCIEDGSSYSCECPAGYDDTNGNGTLCDDIDECTLATDDCDALVTCTNTVGSFIDKRSKNRRAAR